MSRALRPSILLALVLALIPAPAGAADLDVSFEVVRETPVSVTIRATISGATGPLDVTARVDGYRDTPAPGVTAVEIQQVSKTAVYRHTPEYETVRIPIDEKIAALEAEVAALKDTPLEKGEDTTLREEAIDGKKDELAALYAEADYGATYYEAQEIVAHRYALEYREARTPVAVTNPGDRIRLPSQSWAESPPDKLVSDKELGLGSTLVNWGEGVYTYEYTVSTGEARTDAGWGSAGMLVLTIDGKDYYDDTNSSWWDSEWLYRMPLTFDAATMTTDLVDFTTTVFLTPDRFRYDLCQPTGNDVRFVDSDGTSLPYEVDVWVQDGTSVFHVLVPHIPAGSTDDYIWLYYGEPRVGDGSDAAAAWADHWEAVYHMADKPGDSTMILDSTSNANHGTKGAGTAAPTEVAGAVGMAQSFDGGDGIIVAESASLNISGDVTVLSLINPTSVATAYQAVFADTETGANRHITAHVATNKLRFSFGNGVSQMGYESAAGTVVANETHLYGCKLFVQSLSFWKDGTQVGDAQNTFAPLVVQAGDHRKGIGRRTTNSEPFTGTLHELRISSSALSEDENKAIYMSLFDTFIDYGDTEDEEAPAPEPIEDWTAAALLLLLTFIALKERHIMTYTAAFLFLIMYGWSLGTDYLGLTICVMLFAGYMLYQVSLSLMRRA